MDYDIGFFKDEEEFLKLLNEFSNYIDTLTNEEYQSIFKRNEDGEYLISKELEDKLGEAVKILIYLNSEIGEDLAKHLASKIKYYQDKKLLVKAKKAIDLTDEEWNYIKLLDETYYKAIKERINPKLITRDELWVWVEGYEVHGTYYGD